MKKHVSILVTGKVQGVFYRASAEEKAKQLGLTGFVRNESDGSVYIEVEGNEISLQHFEIWCRQGPSRARVDECIVRSGVVKNFDQFTIQQ